MANPPPKNVTGWTFMYLPDIPKIFYLPEKEKHLDFRDLEVFFFDVSFAGG